MLSSKFSIVLAPTGMIPTKSQTPYVPVSPKEIASDVHRCSQIGITSVHIHARDDSGAPDWRMEKYQEIVYAVKSLVPEILINVSTSGRSWSELEKRADCLALQGDLRPDLASLTLSSLNFLSGPSVNSPDIIYNLARMMLERDITPELEIFDLGMVNMANVLQKKGLLPEAIVANLFMGNIAGVQPSPSELGIMVDRLPTGTHWSGAGIGEFRDQAHAITLGAGGSIRVGLEDGIYLDRSKTQLATNELLVERVHQMAGLLDRGLMTSSEFKTEILKK